MPKSKPPRKKNTRERNAQVANRIERNIAPGKAEQIRQATDEAVASSALRRPNPLGLDLSDPATLTQRQVPERVPDPKGLSGRVDYDHLDRDISKSNRARALEMARSAQTKEQIASDQEIIFGITGPDPAALQGEDVTPEQARVYLQSVIAADIPGYAEDLQRLSSTMLMGFQEDGLDIPDVWVTNALDREQREIHRQITYSAAVAALSLADKRRLTLDAELLALVREQGDDPADPRLVLLSPEARADARSYGITIDPAVEALITEDIRERLLHVMLGKDDRFEPILGKPTSMRLNPARGLATGDLRKAQMHAIEQGVPEAQVLDPRLDTLLDDGGTHFLLMADLLDEDASSEHVKIKDGDPPRPFMAGFVRCQIWAKTAFSGHNQAIHTHVTLPLQDYMLAPTVTQILPTCHPAYGRNAARVLDLAKGETIPYFEISMEEMTGATAAPTYPQVQRGGPRLQTNYFESVPDEAPLVVPREVYEGLPPETQQSLRDQGVRFLN